MTAIEARNPTTGAVIARYPLDDEFQTEALLDQAQADLARGRALARRLETGGVFINGYTASGPRVPVGGVKHRGYGRELSHFGIREFVNAQTVWVKP